MSNLLVPIILLISSIGLFFSYLSPAYETLAAFQAQEKRLDEALVKFEQVRQKKEDLTKQYVSFKQPDLDRLKVIIPNKIDEVETIIILDKLAQNANLGVASFSIPGSSGSTYAAAPAEGEQLQYGSAGFRIELVGSYENLRSFLYQAEQSLALLDVTELTVESSGDLQLPPGFYKFYVTLNTYWLY
jgi:hypothetical protein